MAKSERLYLRTTTETKEYLQDIADNYEIFEGSISAVIDFLIERLPMHLEGVGENE